MRRAAIFQSPEVPGERSNLKKMSLINLENPPMSILSNPEIAESLSQMLTKKNPTDLGSVVGSLLTMAMTVEGKEDLV